MGEAFLAGQKGCGTKFKTGSYTNDDSRYNKTIIIDVGFTPDIVILYTELNNEQYIATTANTTARFNHVPKILTAAFTNIDDSYGRIKENGFSSYINAGTSLYYIAIKF